jgi:hypothetical protein
LTRNITSMISEYEWLRNFINEEIYVLYDQPESPVTEQQESTAVNIPETDGAEQTGSPAPDQSADNKALPAPEFRGKNRKNILILLDKPLKPAHEDLLVKIMQAAGLDWDDVALVVWHDEPRADLIKTLKSHVVINFGLESDPWCDTEPYEITAANGLSHLQADSLASLAEDVELKRKLWSALKTLFGV